ncbi:hypothetical protein P154DRAFT_576431 [Amniculicola lignicola CBS 123094]|uniref:Uncharacterized protein n=1 Tax=Amniculicola lignicola CBS 123094 TaxID=1392246 RepID=A0A6A5WIX1_9PLEO|nr:hypothetical protein P154DRAFT_576431 [Amniculicola lignicola CBS 123094]
MPDIHPHHDQFAKLGKDKMKEKLCKCPTADSGTSVDATPTSLATGSQLQCLLAPTKSKVSSTTLQCLQKLQYTPAKKYHRKPSEKDLPEILQPVELFVGVFLRTLDKVHLTSESRENVSTFSLYLSEDFPTIEASLELASFFPSWNIGTVSKDDGTSAHQNTEYEIQLALALHASKFTAESEARKRQGESQENPEGEKEKYLKARSKELDILTNALHHWLQRCSYTFPKRVMADMLLPSTFSPDGRTIVKKYMHEYILDHGLENTKVTDPESAEIEAVEEIWSDKDFPVPMAHIRHVIPFQIL